MKKLLFMLSALVSAAFAACSARGDTPIPDGPALYDVTITFTDYPELYDHGDWPVEINLQLGQVFYGERISVVTNQDSTISLTVRAAWDISKMIEYSKSENYKSTQVKIYTRNNIWEAGDSTAKERGGTWTGGLKKLDFTGVSTIEGFLAVVAASMMDTETRRTMTKPSSRTEEGEKVLLQALAVKLVGTLDQSPCKAGEPVACTMRVRFNRPISEMGYDHVSAMRAALVSMSNKTVFDIRSDTASLSQNSCEVTGLVTVDVGAIYDLTKSEAYTSDNMYRGQPKVFLNGSSTYVGCGSLAWVTLDTPSVFALSQWIRGALIYRTYDGSACHVVGMELLPKAKTGSLMFMKW